LEGSDLEGLPEAVIDPTPSVGVLLQNLTSREVSVASGLPLDRAKHALELLRHHNPEKSAPNIASDAATEAVIAPVAFEVARQVLKSPGVGAPAIGGDAAAPLSTTIEECVARLRAEARRVLPPAEEQENRSSSDAETAKALSERLLEVADALFDQADFVVITDAAGRMERGNGAFQALLGTAEESSKAEHASHLQIWQGVFQRAPVGYSTFTNPAPIPKAVFARRADPQYWELRRTAVEDAAGGDLKAYINFLHIKDALRPNAEVLRQVDTLLSRVTMFGSLYALGSAERRQEYARELDSLVRQLESAVHEGATQTTAPSPTEEGN
jgi:hypothetical protein